MSKPCTSFYKEPIRQVPSECSKHSHRQNDVKLLDVASRCVPELQPFLTTSKWILSEENPDKKKKKKQAALAYTHRALPFKTRIAVPLKITQEYSSDCLTLPDSYWAAMHRSLARWDQVEFVIFEKIPRTPIFVRWYASFRSETVLTADEVCAIAKSVICELEPFLHIQPSVAQTVRFVAVTSKHELRIVSNVSCMFWQILLFYKMQVLSFQASWNGEGRKRVLWIDPFTQEELRYLGKFRWVKNESATHTPTMLTQRDSNPIVDSFLPEFVFGSNGVLSKPLTKLVQSLFQLEPIALKPQHFEESLPWLKLCSGWWQPQPHTSQLRFSPDSLIMKSLSQRMVEERCLQLQWTGLVAFWNKVNQARAMQDEVKKDILYTMREIAESDSAAFVATNSFFSYHAARSVSENDCIAQMTKRTMWCAYVAQLKRKALFDPVCSREWQKTRLFYANGYLQVHPDSETSKLMTRFVLGWLRKHFLIENLVIVALVKHLGTLDLSQFSKRVNPGLCHSQVGVVEPLKEDVVIRDLESRKSELVSLFKPSTREDKKKLPPKRFREVLSETNTFCCWLNDPMCLHSQQSKTLGPALLLVHVDPFPEKLRVQFLLRCGCDNPQVVNVANFDLEHLAKDVLGLLRIPEHYLPLTHPSCDPTSNKRKASDMLAAPAPKVIPVAVPKEMEEFPTSEE